MPTVIDSLVLELGLDSSKMSRDQRRAIQDLRRFEGEATREGKKIEESARRSDQAFALIKKGFLGLVGGASIAGIARFASNMITADAAVGRIAHTMNTSTRDVSAWQGAIRQIGGSSESATSALSGMSGEMNTFLLTGQASFLPVLNRLGVSLFNQNKQLKTAGELYLDIAEAMEKFSADPARKAAMLSMLPGINQDMVNLLLKGRAAVEGYLDAARKVGGVTDADAARAQKYQENLSLLSQTWEQFARVLTNLVTPALTGVFNWFTKLFDAPGKGGVKDNTIFDRLFGEGTSEKLAGWLKARGVAPEVVDEALLSRVVKPQAAPAAAAGGGNFSNDRDMEAYIRSAARARGIDPDVAVKVWESEGKHGVGPSRQSTVVKNGKREESFGPYQLFMGGGLGNKFQQQTGMDPRDPNTTKQQIDFALDNAKSGGWGPWYGWKGNKWAGINPGAPMAAGAAAGSSTSNSSRGGDVNIGTIVVNTQATDANGIATELGPQLQRQNLAAPANTGQQ